MALRSRRDRSIRDPHPGKVLLPSSGIRFGSLLVGSTSPAPPADLSDTGGTALDAQALDSSTKTGARLRKFVNKPRFQG